MHPRARMFLQERENARARGDAGVFRCMNVELARMGYRDLPIQGATQAEPEAEKPVRRAKRPKARCEHGSVPDHCAECSEEALVA